MAERHGRAGGRATHAILMAPAVLLVFAFVVAPTFMALVDSFRNEGEWTLGNYLYVLTEPPYPRVLLNTLAIAALTTLLSMGLAFPAAAFVASRSAGAVGVVVTLLAITLSISVLVKIFAWQVLLARDGPINAGLLGTGLVTQPVPMLFTRSSVVVAMVQIMAPYACLLLIAGMRRIDRDLLVAARTLGARSLVLFRDVYWPQVRFSVVMTTLIVFIGSSGFFVAPALIGGPGETMLGMKMQSDLVNQYDSGLAATTGVLLTLFLLALTFAALRLSGRSFRHMATELAQ